MFFAEILWLMRVQHQQFTDERGGVAAPEKLAGYPAGAGQSRISGIAVRPAA